MDLLTMDKSPTHTTLILCGYRVWSAYKHWGHVDGAVMLQVNKPSEIRDAFEARMWELAKIGEKFFGIQVPNRWVLTWFLPYGEVDKFGHQKHAFVS